jgi:hypothetical protein
VNNREVTHPYYGEGWETLRKRSSDIHIITVERILISTPVTKAAASFRGVSQLLHIKRDDKRKSSLYST